MMGKGGAWCTYFSALRDNSFNFRRAVRNIGDKTQKEIRKHLRHFYIISHSYDDEIVTL
jgi:hypothetical protein